MQWNFFFPSVKKGGSIPSCCMHPFFRVSGGILGHFSTILQWRLLWPGSSAILLSHATCRFSWVKVAFSSRGVCNCNSVLLSPVACQTCVHKSACLWLAPSSPPRLHSKPAQLTDCGWESQAVRCACTRPCTRHTCQLFQSFFTPPTRTEAIIPSNATPLGHSIICVHWRHRPSTSSKPIDCPSEGPINSKSASKASNGCIQNCSNPSTANMNGCDTLARCR